MKVLSGGAVKTFLDVQRDHEHERQRARACSRSRSRPTTRRAGSPTSSSPAPAARCRSTSTAARADPDAADPASRRLVHLDPAHGGRQPQRRPARSSGPTAACTSARATAAAPTTRRTTTPRTRARCSARSCASTRAARRRRTRVPADNPFGNAVWAYGLRNPWRFSFDRATGDLVDRRRRPGPPRGDRLRARRRRPRPRRQLRLALLRGHDRHAASTSPAARSTPLCRGGERPADRTSHPVIDFDARGRRLLLDHRRLRRPRPRPADARRPLRLRRLLRRRSCARSCSRTRRRTPRRATCPSAARRSFGEDACGRVYVASLRRGRCTGSRTARRRRARPARPRPGGGAPQQPGRPPTRAGPSLRVRVARAAHAACSAGGCGRGDQRRARDGARRRAAARGGAVPDRAAAAGRRRAGPC